VNLVLPAGSSPVNVIYSNSLYDPTSLYNTTNGRFTPKIAGWYQFTTAVDVFTVNTAEGGIQIQHSVDGSISLSWTIGAAAVQTTGVAYFNGTTDFAFVQAFSSSATAAGGRVQNRARSSFIATYLGL
jgi:hypothetical protein